LSGSALRSLLSFLLRALLLSSAQTVDGDLRVGLAVSVLDLVALAALLFEHDDLVAPDVVEDLRRHGSSVYYGRSNLDIAVSGGQEDSVERHGFADFGLKAGDVQLLVFRDLELLSADIYNGVHGLRALGPSAWANPALRRDGPGEERI